MRGLWKVNLFENRSKLFKVRAPRNFRNRVFNGRTKHVSITTQTNLDLVTIPLTVVPEGGAD